MVTFHGMKGYVASAFLLLATGVSAAPVTVYRHVGADGVVAFSDEPRAGAEALTVESIEPRAEEVALSVARYDRQLALIEILQADRRAREAARLERRLSELEIELERVRGVSATGTALAEARYVYAPWYVRASQWRGRDRHGVDESLPTPPATRERVSAPLGKFR